MGAVREIRRFVTSGEGVIYQIPLEAFPRLWGYVYLLVVEDSALGSLKVLIDAGSGFGNSNQHLEEGFYAISAMHGQGLTLQDLTHILITHGHIDHFGGLNYLRSRTPALLGIHELDRRVLTNYEERLAVVARRLSEFLVEAGVSPEEQERLIGMYRLNKSLFSSVQVDFTYEAVGMRLGPLEFVHVPGHCAGHVVIRLHDVLFSGDHVLVDISPHQAPERLTLSTGLDQYLKSLNAIRPWASEIRLTLCGHKQPIQDLPARLDEIHRLHADRLQRVLSLLVEPRTIAEVASVLFTGAAGYHELLALEETGAHVEYLYQRGLISIHNLDEMEKSSHALPLRYRYVQGCVL